MSPCPEGVVSGFHSALTFHKAGVFLKGQEEVELVPLSNCGAGAAAGTEEHPGRSVDLGWMLPACPFHATLPHLPAFR